MSLTQIDEVPGHSVKLGERGKKEYRRVFLGKSNNPYEQPSSIASSRLCPQPGQSDLHDSSAYIVDVDVQRHVTDEPGHWWSISYTSSTDYDQDQALSPLATPVKIKWDAEQREQYTNVDALGKYIKNSVGEIIPVKKEDSCWIVSVEKNLKDVPKYLLDFNNVVNAAAITVDSITFPKGTLMVKNVAISETIYETFKGQRLKYRAVSFKLHYRPEGWAVKTPNVSFVQLIEEYAPITLPGGKIKKYDKDVFVTDLVKVSGQKTKHVRSLLHAKGSPIYAIKKNPVKIQIGSPKEPVTEPWPVDKKGLMLPENYKPEDVIYITSNVYRSKPFSLLPLK